MTTGRLTLPVVILISTTCWMLTAVLLPVLPQEPSSYPLWHSFNELGLPPWMMHGASFVLYAIIGYFLIELNNTFAIIRMRASVQTSLYFLLITVCPRLHQLYAGDVAAAALLLSLYFLFKSYQQSQPSTYLFRSFTFIGAGSLLFPQLTLFAPIWLIGAYNFQSLTLRSLCAAVLGWTLPYWFLFGYAFYHQQMELFYVPFIELGTFQPIRWIAEFPVWEVVTLSYFFILFIVSMVHSLVTEYKDKIRTRAYLHFLMLLCFSLFTFILLQPTHSVDLLSLLLVVVVILLGHLYALSNSRLSNGFFIGSTVGLILLYTFNLWTLL